jgi:CRP-like cAMP-binding protein
LPEEDFQRLAPHLQPVSIELSQVICEAGEALSQAYFITEGMVSLISSTTAGETVEVGMIGNEGMLGVPMLFKCDHLPYQLMLRTERNGREVDKFLISGLKRRCIDL